MLPQERPRKDHLKRLEAPPPTPVEPDGWTAYATSMEWLKGYCQQMFMVDSLCCTLNIHHDPWVDEIMEKKLDIQTVAGTDGAAVW